MNITEVLQQIDQCFRENKGAEAEALMQDGIRQAVQEQDDGALLQLLNERLGYYRECSRVEESYQTAEQIDRLLEKMKLQGTIPYATSQLNIANAFRAGGRLEDSLERYLQVAGIYEEQILLGYLSPQDMLIASLWNNMSLLYQEMEAFESAKESLLRALEIVEKQENAAFEKAVTYTNLAATYLKLEQETEAVEAFEKAISIFQEYQIKDAHYGAALSAMGTYYYGKGRWQEGADCFREAMAVMKASLGENEYYARLQENLRACEAEAEKQKEAEPQKETDFISGMELCRAYYEAYGKPMIAEQFPEYEGKIAVGLAGEGSDCFGFDDEWSRDHDWGPGFCLWVTDETYQTIGRELEAAYEALPKVFQGFSVKTTEQAAGRRGVMTIGGFYKRLTGAERYEEIDWQNVEDTGLAAAVNGQVFADAEGRFTAFREQLKGGYPEAFLYRKIAESGAHFSQNLQYNYPRMLKRGDRLTADILFANGIRAAMKLAYYLVCQYPPHDKWLYRGLQDMRDIAPLLHKLQEITEVKISPRIAANTQETQMQTADLIEELAQILTQRLYAKGFISDTDNYLDSHVGELLLKASLAERTNEELVEQIAGVEFEAFDKVRNVGGRASCQNDWYTFSIMRKSQYMTWNRSMLLQYLYDFKRELSLGHNLIEEKYGRMMESTAPTEYAEMAAYFPALTEEKKAIIEEIVKMQVAWMEEFEAEHPLLAGNARSIHSYDDNLYNTSYETYLRGELSTYSDKMLELYGRYVVECAKRGGCLAREIMANSVRLYGYADLDDAEKKMSVW